MSAEPYWQSLPEDVVDQRTTVMPDGYPAPTGYYPNLSGHIQAPIVGNEVYDEQFAPTVIQGANNWTQTVDQHPWMYVTDKWTPAPYTTRPDGHQDPLTDGPSMPDIIDMNMYFDRWQGSSVTAFMDVPGMKFPPVGTQDGVSWTYVQDSARGLTPYNPALLDAKGEMPDTMRGLAPGPNHGWTSVPVQNEQQEANLRAATTQQQVPGHQDLQAASTYAGQSYGAGTASLNVMPNAAVQSLRSRI